ncbi:MAG: transglycosylase SLT domain-containing protein [Phycisphaerae bacterium]|nr:transglycosylase SLT domain-containing protein [Phycisphaerae bacterium]
MSTPVMQDFDLCVVAGPGSRPIERLEDLSDRPVVVARGRAADEMLRALEPQFRVRGLAPPRLIEADARLSIEDVLELVGVGARGKYEYTVLPRPLAEAWARSIRGLKVTGVSVSTGQHSAYAVRKDMPRLTAALNDYLRVSRAPERARELLQAGAPLHSPPLHRVASDSVDARLRELEPLFAEYARKYGLDAVRVAAQCFQESRFDAKARSHAGAMGLMQLLPATAKELGVTDPFDARQSIEGGCKYMDWLHRTYFSDPLIARDDQLDFCLAAYNAGAGNVRKWRALATKRGLDPNKWFGNVGRIARANGVRETVTYVANIAKYEVQFREQIKKDSPSE